MIWLEPLCEGCHSESRRSRTGTRDLNRDITGILSSDV